jgi:hypothetical protein
VAIAPATVARNRLNSMWLLRHRMANRNCNCVCYSRFGFYQAQGSNGNGSVSTNRFLAS